MQQTELRKPAAKLTSVVLLGSRGIPARYGGFETLVEILATRLPKSCFRVTVFCEKALKNLRPSIPGVSTVYFAVFEPFRIASEITYDIVALMWATFAPVEVVILFGYTASIFCILPRITGRTVLINVDGLEWKREKFAKLIRFILKIAESIAPKVAIEIVCDSRSIQSYYRRQYSAASAYAPNPVIEPVHYRPEVLTAQRLVPREYYLVVARLEPENHADMIIEGCEQAESERELIIVGPLLRTRFVEKLLKMNANRVRFVGGIYDRAALYSLRKESFAYIHGHEVGGTNPSLLESMVTGSPIIALDVPFNREVVQGNALYFKNSRELAESIRILESHPIQRNIMGKRARRIALNERARH